MTAAHTVSMARGVTIRKPELAQIRFPNENAWKNVETLSAGSTENFHDEIIEPEDIYIYDQSLNIVLKFVILLILYNDIFIYCSIKHYALEHFVPFLFVK